MGPIAILGADTLAPDRLAALEAALIATDAHVVLLDRQSLDAALAAPREETSRLLVIGHQHDALAEVLAAHLPMEPLPFPAIEWPAPSVHEPRTDRRARRDPRGRLERRDYVGARGRP